MLAAPSPRVRLIFPTCGYGAAIILAFLRPASFTPVAEQPLIDALLVVHYCSCSLAYAVDMEQFWDGRE